MMSAKRPPSCRGHGLKPEWDLKAQLWKCVTLHEEGVDCNIIKGHGRMMSAKRPPSCRGHGLKPEWDLKAQHRNASSSMRRE